MKNKVLSMRDKTLLLILAVLLIIALYIFAVQMPVKNGMENAQNEIYATEDSIVVYQAKYTKMNNMKAELEELKKDDSVQVLPDYDNLKNVMAFLNRVLGDAQDYKMSFDEGVSQEDSTIFKRTGNISFSAPNYEAARKAINSLEDCEYLDRVSNISITPCKNRGNDYAVMNSGAVSVAVTITFYERINNQDNA